MTSEHVPHRSARLKALGNAVVWLQAAPVFAAIVAADEEERLSSASLGEPLDESLSACEEAE